MSKHSLFYNDDEREIDRCELPLDATVMLKKTVRQAEKRDFQLKCNIAKVEDDEY